jgi:hypothetical protein
MSLEGASLQRVQLPARDIHVLRGVGIVQLPELAREPRCVHRLNPCRRASFEETLDALVAEAPDHGDTQGKGQLTAYAGAGMARLYARPRQA